VILLILALPSITGAGDSDHKDPTPDQPGTIEILVDNPPDLQLSESQTTVVITVNGSLEFDQVLPGMVELTCDCGGRIDPDSIPIQGTGSESFTIEITVSYSEFEQTVMCLVGGTYDAYGATTDPVSLESASMSFTITPVLEEGDGEDGAGDGKDASSGGGSDPVGGVIGVVGVGVVAGVVVFVMYRRRSKGS
jgi:hypothetical protein